MTTEDLEQVTNITLPPIFKRFLTEHPNGYYPVASLYISEGVGTNVEKILSVDDIWDAWQNTIIAPFGWNGGESYLKDQQMLIIADLLGSDNFTVGFGQHNLDVIYYLDWHEGPYPICKNIHELLSKLRKDGSG